MTNVFAATYHKMIAIPSRNVVQIVMEVPIERQSEAMAVLGGVLANTHHAEWYAIAKMNTKENVRDVSVGDDGGDVDIGSKGFYRDLYLKILGNPNVCAVWGSDNNFQDWVRSQPPLFDDPLLDGHEDVVFAHVRRANNSGVATEPPYSGVALYHSHHGMQHQFGEKALLNKVMPRTDWTVESAKAFFDGKAAENRRNWCKLKIREFFGVDSMSKVSPQDIREEFNKRNVGVYLNGI